MRKLSSLISGAALTLTAGLLGCVEVDDPFESLTSADEVGDGDGDPTTTGDGDGDPTTTGDGDGDPTTGDGDGDECGSIGDACAVAEDCCAGFTCDASGQCGIGGGDGDGDPTTGGDPPMWGDGPYYGAPPNCQPDEVPLMDGQLPVAGGHCSPVAMCTNPECSNTDACPPAPMDTTAQGTILWADNMGGNYCGLLCMVAADPDECPAGATCKDLMNPMAPGFGACTYP